MEEVCGLAAGALSRSLLGRYLIVGINLAGLPMLLLANILNVFFGARKEDRRVFETVGCLLTSVGVP